MKKKIFLVPGWMNGGGMYQKKGELYEIWDVWKKRIPPKKKIPAEWIVGHSLAGNYILANWEKNQNAKLILVNPLFPKRSLPVWFSRWRKFHREEEPPQEKEIVLGFKKRWFGMRQCWKLLRKDFDAILDYIPKDKIFVVYGEKDYFYCDEKFKKYIQSKRITVIAVSGVGHDWNEKFDREIEKIVLENN